MCCIHVHVQELLFFVAAVVIVKHVNSFSECFVEGQTIVDFIFMMTEKCSHVNIHCL